jgi:uncharacterized membrane protein YbhN (UPF0104 family)/tRNA A-37 threonylcarbamoyl transferase component Bud32
MSGYFVSESEQPRARRARDAVAIVIGVILVGWTSRHANELTGFDDWALGVIDPFPAWVSELWKIGYFTGLVLVAGLVIAAVVGRRWDLLRDILLALAAAVVLAFALAWLVEGNLPTVLPEFTRVSDPDAAFPIVRVAAMTAAIMVAAPYVTRTVRLFAWGMVALVAVSGFGLGFGLPTDAIGAVGLGLAAGGSVLLLFGSPRGYPDLAAIRDALAELGVDIEELSLVPDQSWGVRTLSGSLTDGSPIEVVAYGRDAADTRMAAKAWRGVWYRESDSTISFSRLEAVEHEALAMLIASDKGVSTQQPLAVGIGGDDMALLAKTASGVALDDPTRAQLDLAWQELARLHRAGIAHGALGLDAIKVEDGRVILEDFAHASFNATETQRSLDIVSLLYDSAAAADADDAVGAAMAAMPENDLVTALAYLQVPALSPAQRKAVDKPKALVAEIRNSIIDATGAEMPAPAKLRRVRPKDLLMPALSLIAMYVLIGMLADIDFVAVWDVVRDATWAWIILGFLIGHFAFFFDATGMLFATGYPLPLKPLIVLQVAVKWIGLAVPSAAGRVAMNTLFLRKYGVPPTIALTQGAIDGLSGFVVEAGILLIAFIASDVSLDLSTGDTAWGLILFIVALVIMGTVVAIWRVQRLRDVVIPVLKDAWGSLAGVVKSPKRAFGLLGSNLASRVMLAITLWLILQAIGTPLPLVTALVVTVATNLLAGLVPIPGGIGVAEGVLTSMLVFAGLGADEAFAVAIVFRIATFYIPAGEGFFATQWLEKNGYL